MYKSKDPATPPETLINLFNTARRHLKYVYIGNTAGNAGQETVCSKCGTIVTERSGYSTRLKNLDGSGKCSACGNQVYRYFTLP